MTEASATPPSVAIELSAAVIALDGDTPSILATDAAREPALPSGPFEPLRHRTLDIGLRDWVGEQTGLGLGYVEQLYTFADRGRHAVPGDREANRGAGPHTVSIGYLALARGNDTPEGARWRDWYRHFPWEDWRSGRPAVLDDLVAALLAWSDVPAWRARVVSAFGRGDSWDEERVLDRYECLYEAGLVSEAWRDGRPAALARDAAQRNGLAMAHDHRRILATAISRLRGKVKYRPVIFELMGESFTLTALQRAAEAISGRHLHKQNFRRLVESTGLVEPTGATSADGPGRPAALFRFRREVMTERTSAGLRVGSR